MNEGHDTTITEDLVLLLLNPTTGRAIVDGTSLDHSIGGALLLDLSTHGRVTADGAGARVRLTVAGAAPTGDSLLDAALARLTGRPRNAQRAVERARPQGSRAGARAAGGAWPGAAPPRADARADPDDHLACVRRAPREELRCRVAAVLLDGGQPDQHVACLISLLHAVKAEHRVVDGPRRQLRPRAEEVTRGDWAGPAVRKAVQAVQAVQSSVATAVAVSAAAAGSAGSS